MEILKKLLFVTLFALLFSGAKAQSSAVMQAAFSKSYVSEQAENYTTAIADIKEIYSADSYILNVRLGWLNYMAKQYPDAINYYNKAIALKPYAIEARFGCVKPLSALESWEKVKEQYLQILKIDPQNVTANYWLGLIYYNRKDFTNACKNFEQVVNLYPLDYDSVIMLAWSKLNNGKPSDAKVLFSHALILRPADSSATSGLAQIK